MRDHRIAVPLGIPGLIVTSCVNTDLGLDVHVETETAGGLCPECEAVALVPKERPVVVVRDLPIQGRPTYLVWRKRRYACPACERSFTEAIAEIPPEPAARAASSATSSPASARAPRSHASPRRRP